MYWLNVIFLWWFKKVVTHENLRNTYKALSRWMLLTRYGKGRLKYIGKKKKIAYSIIIRDRFRKRKVTSTMTQINENINGIYRVWRTI